VWSFSRLYSPNPRRSCFALSRPNANSHRPKYVHRTSADFNPAYSSLSSVSVHTSTDSHLPFSKIFSLRPFTFTLPLFVNCFSSSHPTHFCVVSTFKLWILTNSNLIITSQLFPRTLIRSFSLSLFRSSSNRLL
jgi:hypothetical protein